MIKYSNYITNDSICQLICKLIEKVRKIKVILEYNYYFEKKVNKVIFINSGIFISNKNQEYSTTDSIDWF